MTSMTSFRKWSCNAPLVACLICCFFGSFVLPPSIWALDLSEEKELGAKVLEKVKHQMPLIEEGEIVAYVRSLGSKMVKQMGTTLYDYQFFVIDKPDVNAFAVPGGYVFVYRGLIEALGSEGELASIIGHELAHVQARHIQRRMEQGKVLSIATLVGALAAAFLGMSAGGDASRAVLMGSMAGSKSLELKYSRDNEEEADQLGFRYLCDAGYDPIHTIHAMQALGQNRIASGTSNIPSYLSTHPGASERIQYLQVMVDDYRKNHPQSQQRSPANDEEFKLVRAALISEYSDSKIAMARMQAEYRQGGEASAYGLGRLYLREGHIEEAIPYLQDAASRHPSSPLVLTTLGSAYFQLGRLNEAQRVLQSALLVDPSSTSARYRLALALKDLGQRDEALQNLLQIEKYSSGLPDIDYQLGVLFGQMQQLGMAHYHLGRYYLHENDSKTAVFHYKKAKELLRGDPKKLAEVERELKKLEKKNKKIARDIFKNF